MLASLLLDSYFSAIHSDLEPFAFLGLVFLPASIPELSYSPNNNGRLPLISDQFLERDSRERERESCEWKKRRLIFYIDLMVPFFFFFVHSYFFNKQYKEGI